MNKATYIILFSIMINSVVNTSSEEERQRQAELNKVEQHHSIVRVSNENDLSVDLSEEERVRVQNQILANQSAEHSNEEVVEANRTLSANELNKATSLISGKVDQSSEESVGQSDVKNVQTNTLVLKSASEEETPVEKKITPMQNAVNNHMKSMVNKKMPGLDMGAQSLPLAKVSKLDYDEKLFKPSNSAPQLNHESKINPDDNQEFSKIVSISAIVLALLF